MEIEVIELHSSTIPDGSAKEIASAMAKCTSLKFVALHDCHLSIEGKSILVHLNNSLLTRWSALSFLLTGIEENKLVKKVNISNVYFTNNDQNKKDKLLDQLKQLLSDSPKRKICLTYNDFAVAISKSITPEDLPSTTALDFTIKLGGSTQNGEHQEGFNISAWLAKPYGE